MDPKTGGILSLRPEEAMSELPTHRARCGLCGQPLEESLVLHEEQRGDRLFLFRNVPAQVCSACGETWIAEGTLAEVDRLIQEGKPSEIVETMLFDLAASR